MKKLENIKFKKPSSITNGMAWMDLPVEIIKIVDEKTCIDNVGNIYLYSGNKNIGDICECIIINYYPQLHEIEECYYNGKKVLTFELDYSHDFYKHRTNDGKNFEFIDQQVIYNENPIKINCGKNNIKLNFERKDYVMKVAIIKDVLSRQLDLTNQLIKSVYECGIGYRYDGGGYGEKYYLSGVYFYPNGFKKWLSNALKLKYINNEFIKFLEYKELYNYLIDENNWDVVVESVPYEGYCVQGIKFIGDVFYINELLLKSINKFNGSIINDFGFN